MVVFSEFIAGNKDKEVLKQAADELEVEESEISVGSLVHAYILRCLKLYSRTLSHGQGLLTFYSNYYMGAILNAIDPGVSMSSEDQIAINDDTLKRLQGLKEKIFQKIKPIQKNVKLHYIP